MSEIQGLREQILANTKYLPLPDPPRPTKQKTSSSPAYELLIARSTPPAGFSITETLRASTTTTSTTAAADVASYKALLLTAPNEGAHIRIEGPVAETIEGALQGMLEVTAGMVEREMKRRGGEAIKREEILDSRQELGNGVLVVMRVPDEAMEMEMQGGGDGEGDGTGEQVADEGDGGAVGKGEGKRGAGRPRKAAEGGGAAASAAGVAAGGAAVDGEGRVVKRGRGRPKKNAG